MQAAFNKDINYMDKLTKCLEQAKESNSKVLTKRIVWYGTKGLVQICSTFRERTTYQESLSKFQLFEYIKAQMSRLTPNEFMTVFPVTKEYNGKRYETKDYFTAMEYINSLDRDKPIGVNIDEFLREYNNLLVSIFLVQMLSVIDDIRRFNGEEGMLESFTRAHNLTTYTLHTAPNGKQYMQDNKTGRTFPVKKKNPFKVVKAKNRRCNHNV